MTETEILITLAIAGGLAAILIYILKRRKPVKPTRSAPLYQQAIGRTTRPHWPRDTEATRKTHNPKPMVTPEAFYSRRTPEASDSDPAA